MKKTVQILLLGSSIAAFSVDVAHAQESLPHQSHPADVGRRLPQWVALQGFVGVMSSGQKLAGGALKIARLRQRHTYITIANLRFAASPARGEHAAFFGLSVQSGLKLAAGAEQAHVFYLGVEAGFGAAGYDIRDASNRRVRTATNSFLLSPHLEYNFHLADHAALVIELKVLPGLFNGATTADKLDRKLIVDRPPWVFGAGIGMAF